MGDPIAVVIADDHPFFRHGLRAALEKDTTIRVVAETSDGLAALERIRTLKPAVAILDIGLPEMDGFAVVRSLRAGHIPVEVVFLTVADDEDIFEAALACGVKGYLLKDCTESEIIRCIKAVCAGQHYASPSMTTYLVGKTRRIERFAAEHPDIRRLTAQEREILRRIADGKTSKEIAQELFIAAKTVDVHRSNICHKLDLHGSNALARFAAQHRTEI